MKSLNNMEPRTPLVEGAADTISVQTSDNNYHFVILKSGSYYLTSNLAVTRTHGIDIRVEGVELNLNGFTISRMVEGTGNGINVISSAHGGSIQNGTIKGFHTGISNPYAGARGKLYRDLFIRNCTGSYGIYAGTSSTIDRCRISNCYSGIFAFNGSVVKNCSVSAGLGAAGIVVFEGCSVSDCTVSDSNFSAATSYAFSSDQSSIFTRCTVNGVSATYGIQLGSFSIADSCTVAGNSIPNAVNSFSGSLIKNCNVSYNGAVNASITSNAGINTSEDCVVENCVVRGTQSVATPLGNLTGMGINVGSGSTVRDCTVANNYGAGIRAAGSRSRIIGNHCESNGSVSNGNAAGIVSDGFSNHVEGNSSITNDRGYEINGTQSILIGNTACNNTTNYNIDANNKVGTIVSAPNSVAISGSTGGSGVGTTNRWDNISF